MKALYGYVAEWLHILTSALHQIQREIINPLNLPDWTPIAVTLIILSVVFPKFRRKK